ncbi:hypothetical protein Adt_41551 [Abeliophyllum distichum]|uniref:Uncharacterized protein n=1 Tax=Abeliophyllum distichum TaxID=126358 RepID=A0ABD1PPA2_9LAMI
MDRLKNGANVRDLLRDKNGQRLIEIYIVEAYTPHSLPMEANKEPTFDKPMTRVANDESAIDDHAYDGCYVPMVEEDSSEEPQNGLVESDYEMEDEHVIAGEVGNENVNFDFGFGVLDGEEVR